VPGAFARTLLVGDAEVGVQTLVQAHGIGRIKTNMTLFGVRDLRGSAEDRVQYGQMLQNCVRFGTNVAVLNVRQDSWREFENTPRDERTIALWWSDDRVGRLITLLAWLCERDPSWSQAKMIAYVPSDENHADIEEVQALLDKARIKAEVVQVDATPAALTTALSSATLALAPLRVRRGSAIGPFETPLGMLVESLPLAIMVLATEEVELVAEPDESDLTEIARLSDELVTLEQRTATLDADASRLLVAAETSRLIADAAPDDAELAAKAEATQQEAQTAFRRYVTARAECRNLQDDLATLDPAGVSTNLDPEIWTSSSTR